MTATALPALSTTAATAIEYRLIGAGISIAIISVVNGLETKLKTTFTSISTQLQWIASAAACWRTMAI
jgi:pilus assembly protein Flp/PilA